MHFLVGYFLGFGLAVCGIMFLVATFLCLKVFLALMASPSTSIEIWQGQPQLFYPFLRLFLAEALLAVACFLFFKAYRRYIKPEKHGKPERQSTDTDAEF